VSDKYISDISKQCVNKKFTFAHLQQIYINAANIALCENRDKPNEDDLKKSLKEVNEEKKVSDNDFVSKQRDLIDDEDE
jgi:ATP-dependent 26S proteasome regulatory subunit